MTFLPESWQGFEFAYPWLLLALLVLPVMAWWLGRAGPLPSVIEIGRAHV